MDTLHTNLHEIADHRDDVEVAFGRGATRVHPLAAKPAVRATTAGAGCYHDAAIEAARREAIEARSNPYHR